MGSEFVSETLYLTREHIIQLQSVAYPMGVRARDGPGLTLNLTLIICIMHDASTVTAPTRCIHLCYSAVRMRDLILTLIVTNVIRIRDTCATRFACATRT